MAPVSGVGNGPPVTATAIEGVGSMIRFLYLPTRERRWNRDRSRRIAAMRERERATRTADIGWVEAMAIQLAEIRALPEALGPQR
jgi:hypothetical protein